jgi:hypothetical protein
VDVDARGRVEAVRVAREVEFGALLEQLFALAGLRLEPQHDAGLVLLHDGISSNVGTSFHICMGRSSRNRRRPELEKELI